MLHKVLPFFSNHMDKYAEEEAPELEFGKTYLISTEFEGKMNYDLRKIIKPGSLKPGYGILKPLNPDWGDQKSN